MAASEDEVGLLDLPEEILALVLSKLSAQSLVILSAVSCSFLKLTCNPALDDRCALVKTTLYIAGRLAAWRGLSGWGGPSATR